MASTSPRNPAGSTSDDDSYASHARIQQEQQAEELELRNEILGNNNQKENRMILAIRGLTLLLLLTATLTVSLVLYIIISRTHRREFQRQFENRAEKVLSSFGDTTTARIDALSAFAFDMVSFAKATNQTWPAVTIPDFEQRGQNTMKLSSIISLLVCPIVYDDTERLAWEEHSRENNQWLAGGLAIQERRRDPNWVPPANWTAVWEDLPETIVNLTAQYETLPGPWTPTWQVAPAVPLTVIANFNLISHSKYTPVMKAVMETQEIAISNTYVPPFDRTNLEDYTKTSALALYLKTWEEYGSEYHFDPVSDLVFPVLDPESKKLVAFLKCFVYWRTYLLNLLPEDSGSVLAVIENSCDESFSYEIAGSDVTFLGPGDHHDPKFNDMIVEASFQSFTSSSIKFSSDVREGNCRYRLLVHPTNELEDMYITRTPQAIALLVALVFVFTSSVFLVYDRLVRKRQEKVLRNAVRSGKIVSSLFPKTVRDRMFDEAATPAAEKPAVQQRLTAFLRQRSRVGSNEENLEDSQDEDPIADDFENCTVFFADLVGFTKWSEKRFPTDVFFLLEAVYRTFDKIARRKGVFKVETIGDCYLAVTGLPEPNKDHAVTMAGFALSCMRKLRSLLDELAPRLGDDTKSLEIRCGIHSGKVTAGVLRGEKSRFQLFGDTVNTASRAESTGKPGRIQITESTRDALLKSNYAGGLEKREEKVHAKGKGEMQTWWLLENNNDHSISHAESFDELLKD